MNILLRVKYRTITILHLIDQLKLYRNILNKELKYVGIIIEIISVTILINTVNLFLLFILYYFYFFVFIKAISIYTYTYTYAYTYTYTYNIFCGIRY